MMLYDMIPLIVKGNMAVKKDKDRCCHIYYSNNGRLKTAVNYCAILQSKSDEYIVSQLFCDDWGFETDKDVWITPF